MKHVAARQRIVSRFVEAGATSPERPIDYVPGEDEATTFRRLCRSGAVGTAGEGRYWLDAERLHRFRGAHRRRLAAWVASSGIAATIAATAAAFALAE